MAAPQEWIYTKDGKNKVGPVSSAALKTLAKSGQLLPTDMVCKVGTAQWVPASSIAGLFAATPNLARTKLESSNPEPESVLAAKGPVGDPSPRTQAGGDFRIGQLQDLVNATMISRLSLGLAIFFALLAAVCALLRFGGDILSPLVAGLAILSGLVAVGLSALTNRAFLGSAATAVFLAFAALLFSIGCSVFERVISKAAEVGKDREAAELARSKAQAKFKEAQEKLDDAEVAPKRILQEAEFTRIKAQEKLKEAQDKLDQAEVAPRSILKEAEKKFSDAKKQEATNKIEMDNLAAQLTRDKEDFDKRKKAIDDKSDLDKRAFDKRQDELAKEKTGLLKREDELASGKTQLAIDIKIPEAMKKEANIAKAAADAAEIRSKKLNEEAVTKEKDAKEHLKFVKEEYKKIQNVLTDPKNKSEEKKKAAINAIERIGKVPESAKVDLREMNHKLWHDLCVVAVSDVKLRRDALAAIHKVELDLGKLAAFLINVPAGTDAAQYTNEIKKLVDFGHAGLPLCKAVLELGPLAGKQFDLTEAWNFLKADLEVLAHVAQDDDEALGMLLDAHKWSLAQKIGANRARSIIGRHLSEITKKAEPQTRIKTVPYFIGLLRSQASADRLLAIETLATFGPDAKDALKQLTSLQSNDLVLDVRAAATNAIAKIDKAK